MGEEKEAKAASPISTRKVAPKAPSMNHSTEISVDPRFYTEKLAPARSIGYRGMR
jgi:hypothetical protein